MKITFLAILLTFSGLAAVNAQCTVDSAALDGTLPVYPPPETTDHPEWGIDLPACAGQAFEFTITFAVPDTFNYQGPLGVIPIPLNYVELAANGAVTSTPNPSPTWLGYTCSPSNCKFLKNTLGCVKLFGNVPANAVLDSFDLQIAVTVATALGNFPVSAPTGLSIPGYYRLRTYPTGHAACTVAADELAKTIYRVEASPNPFSYLTTLKIEVLQAETIDFQVFNLMGQRVESRRVQLFPGTNQLEFDASALPNGVYQYSIGNEKGQRTGKLAVNR